MIESCSYVAVKWEKMENKKVNYKFKFLYTIGIIFIVAGHCKNGGISIFYEWFPPYSFHLALFMFASGYFYKENSEENVKKYIWKKVKKLIIPMYIWNFVYAIFTTLIKLKGFSIGSKLNMYNIFIAPILNGHQFVFTMCLWYVVPLFMIEVLNILIRKILKLKIENVNEYVFFIVSLLSGMLGTYLASKGYNKGWYLFLDRILYFIPFFSLGILYNKKLEKSDKLNNTIYFTIIFLIQLLIITINGKPVTCTPSWCNFNGNVIMPFIVGTLGIAFWLRIAQILEPIVRNSRVVNIISENTFSIMVHQFLGFFAVNTIFAICSKFVPAISNFNWHRYKTDIWYYYLPNDIKQWYIIYLIAGIIVPLIISYILEKLKDKITNNLIQNNKLFNKRLDKENVV